MKTNILVLLFLVVMIWPVPGCYTGNVSQDNKSQYNTSQDNSAYPEYNVDDLNQYGEWVEMNKYGRVWHPLVINNWQPFTNGHWSWDGNDWVWVSYEPFGWIVCHYGSWDYSPEYGWFWIPGGDEWTPACVQWVDYGDYIGWAPRRHIGSWADPWENNKANHWVIVRKGDFNKEDVNSFRVSIMTRVENTNQFAIQRHQPDVKIIQHYVKDPIGKVKITREPVLSPPQRIVPPVRIENPTLRTNPPINPPPGRIHTPPVKNQDGGIRHIVRMQVPPAEKQKVDKYRLKVEKDVLRKKDSPQNK